MKHVQAITQLADSDQPGAAQGPKARRSALAEHQPDDTEPEQVDRQYGESRPPRQDEGPHTTGHDLCRDVSQGGGAGGREHESPT